VREGSRGGCNPPLATGHPARRKARGAGGALCPAVKDEWLRRWACTPAGAGHSPLTACPGPRLAGHGRWRGRDAPSARAASLASSAALPVPALAALGRGGLTYVIPYVNPYVILYAQGWRTPVSVVEGICPGHAPRGASRPQRPRPTGPPRGKGALRAIDSFRRSRSWRTCGPPRLRQAESGLVVANGGGQSGAGSAVQVGCRQRPGAATGGGRPYRPTHRRRRRPRSHRAPCYDEVKAQGAASVVRHAATVPGGTASYQPTPQGEHIQDTLS
jgi:hypothetical protein